MDRNTRCGFIGLGSQGAPIARRIIDAGYSTRLWARREETLRPFQKTDARIADSIAHLAQEAIYIGVCVTGDEAVTEVCEEAIAHMPRGGVIAIHSTVLPDTCRKLEARAASQGIALLDAPVSGGPQVAALGRLTVMAGGNQVTLDRIRPVLDTFAEQVIYLGEVGAGQTAKLLNNSLMVANMGLLHSAVQAGMEQGLERDQFLQLLQHSSGRSFSLEVYQRNPDIAKFDRLESLIGKVELLGTVCGQEHATYALLRNACEALRN